MKKLVNHILLGLLCFVSFSCGMLQSPLTLALDQKQNEAEIRPSLTEKQLSSLSLSVGTVLGSLNFDYYSIALSNDGRFAFASFREAAGKVNILDISDLQAPCVIGVINLAVPTDYYNWYLKLSPNGKTLFASNFEYLGIINISNINSPKVLAKIRDPNAQHQETSMFYLPQVYQMSMAFSGDGKRLFVGGLGLQIFNISNLENPQLDFSKRSDPLEFEFGITSVSVASDGKTLLYANGTLNIMQSFGFDEPKTLGSYSSRGLILSVMLSPDGKTAYVTLSGIEEKVIIEKLDVSDYKNPRKIKEYELTIPKARLRALVFMAATPAFSHLFLSVDIDDWESEIVTFNMLTEEFLDMHNSLVQTTDSLVFSADNRILLTTSESLFEIIELKFDYPNSRTFSLSENLLFELKTQSCLVSMALSADNNLLFTIEGCGGNASFVIYDIKNVSSPEAISSSSLLDASGSSNITVSNDNKRVFISTSLTISVWNTSSLSSPQFLETFTVRLEEGIQEYTLSADGNYVFLFWKTQFASMSLKILNLSSIGKFQEIPCSILADIPLGARLALSKDNKVLYALKRQTIEAYDISDISAPVKRFSMDHHAEGQRVSPKSFAVSKDNKILVISVQDSILEKLHIYDISDPSNPQFKSEFTRPKSELPFITLSPIFSLDLTKVYLMQPNGLMTINITNLEKPKIASIFAISNDSKPNDFLVSNNNRLGFIKTHQSSIRIISLETPYTVYLNRESFYLGEKYAGDVILFGRSSQKTYVPLDQESHKFLKTGLLDIRVVQTEKNTKQVLSSLLPYWMNFDKENSVITVEAKKQLDLGVYSLYTAFSKQIPVDAFYQAEAVRNGSIAIEDVLNLLISNGYIDHKRFLTSDFGAYGDFVLPKRSQARFQQDLYNVLKQYYFEVVTTFDILPSLDVTVTNKKLLIKTLSDEPVRADIKLFGLGMQFVNKHYASLQPVITEDRTRMILEGTQKDMNKALEMIVVNLENVEEWGGTIAIYDHLNPIVTKTFANISELFKVNEKPIQKVSIQQQIDAWEVYTGVHFAINLSNETFVDKYNAGLSYHLEMEDPAKTLPAWISFGDDLILKGTPPEEFFYQEMRFSLLVKNEFKGIEVPFALKIKLSWTFGLKLLVKNSPYILTLIGLIVYANKIYNIVFKKRYRYPKDFYLKVGQEIGTEGEGIPPIVFVFQEKKESELILREMEKFEDSRRKNSEFASFFAGQDQASRIDRMKVEEKIKKVLLSSENLKKKLHCYMKGSEVSQKLIKQMIFNQLTFWFLEEERNKHVRRVFDEIKEEWLDLVDWNIYGMCKANEAKLAKLIHEKQQMPHNGEYYQMNEDLNLDLLKDAIEGYAFAKQSINYRAIQANIIVKEKIEDRNVVFQLTKYDLVNVNFSDKGKMGYGMYYKIQNDVLSFYGVPEEKFAGKTMVVQITNKKHRILNEIWIHGGKKTGEINEDIEKGESYEIY